MSGRHVSHCGVRTTIAALAILAMLASVLSGFDSGPVGAQDATPVPAAPVGQVGTSGQTATGDITAAQQQLADKYAPIAMLRAQTAACDKDGEGYFPSPVDFIFGNPAVVLKAKGDGDASEDVVLSEGFTPQELVTAGPNTYFDFPGNPRDPGCTYEQYFKQMVAEYNLEPTTYVRFVTDEAAGKLYVEYWFWYLFNDWNNTHETDWEMVYIVFNTTSVEEALTMNPERVGYAQHGGGEYANWGDDKIHLQGDRLFVYPAAGSHATYFDEKIWISWGENGTGFGCDNTAAPTVETPLNAVVIPDVIDPDGEFAWALYEGHWGQRESSVFNGPTGPNMGSKWNDPTAAFGNWRTTSLSIPGGRAGGLSATDLFCGLSEWGSKATIYLGSRPWLIGGLLALVLGIIGLSVYRVWGYFMEALDIYGNEIRTFLGIGMLAIPIGIVFNLLMVPIRKLPPFEWMIDWFNDSAGGNLTLVAMAGGAQQVAMTLVIVPAVIYAMKDIREGIKPGVWRSLREGLHYFPSVTVALILYVVALGAAALSVLLIPVAIYFAVRWLFYPQAAVLDDAKPGWNALRQSMRVTKGEWVRTFGSTIGFLILALVPGPLIGVLILILGGSRVQFANIVSSFLYGLLLPLAYIGLTMVYHRLKGIPIVEPQMQTHELHPDKARKLPGQDLENIWGR